MPIVGTAGHVDHGKSTLVQALTGRDPDRWQEEKDRGLTIDLGFAWAEVNGHRVGFVDVPGHERFVRNMLAGVGGFDVALLVVAGDEGWMPQSEEHLAVLDLLDVRHGVVALTRVDLADPELVELARSDVEGHLAETVGASWPIVEVAAPAGIGLEELRAALASALDAAGPSVDRGRPRLWIDRSFLIAGAGVVVTGTLTGGSLAAEDRLEAVPGGPVRVRGLQSHEESLTRVEPGSRVAANLTGLDRDRLERGVVLMRTGDAVLSDRMLVRLLRPPRASDEISDRDDYHAHLGTATVPARIRRLDDSYAVARLRRPLPVEIGDRFILRDTGRRRVVGGGMVLDPSPIDRPTPEQAALLDAALGDADALAGVLVSVHGAVDAALVAAATGGGKPEGVTLIAGRYISEDSASGQIERAQALVAAFHAEHSLRPGMPASSLASQLGVGQGELAALIEQAPELVGDGPTVRQIGFTPALDADDEQAWRAARETLSRSLAVPRAGQLGISDEVRHALVRRGDLVAVSDDLVYLPGQIEEIVAALDRIEEPFTVAAFRDALGLSRRQAVPLLEWLDRNGNTVRDGDVRLVRRN